jgi:hypothetical protein
MGRDTCVLLLAFCLTGCAAALTESRTVDSLATLQIKERAGLYPGDWSVRGDSHARYLEKLQRWADDQGIVVAAAPIASKNLLGHASRGIFTGWVILINDRLPVNNRLYTLLHELGHVYGPQDVTAEQGEVIAEMVAAQVCEDVGLNVWGQTAAYLVTYVPIDRQSATVQRHGSKIDNIVKKLSRAVRE